MKVPLVNDALDEPVLTCPPIAIDTDLVTCDLIYKSGGKIQGAVNFGDGSTDTIDKSGWTKKLFF